MNRVSKHQNKLLIMLKPQMHRLMYKMKQNYDESYFQLDETEKDIVCTSIAVAVITATLEILNFTINPDEIEAIKELANINLEILEQNFIDLEMYSFAQIMLDSRSRITNEIFTMVGTKL